MIRFCLSTLQELIFKICLLGGPCRYLAAVSDVLTSVQKTEESLKRLRKERTAQTSNNGTSDDDKIRMQLVIDVDSFVKDAQSMSIDLLPELKALLDAVENARNLSRK